MGGLSVGCVGRTCAQDLRENATHAQVQRNQRFKTLELPLAGVTDTAAFHTRASAAQIVASCLLSQGFTSHLQLPAFVPTSLTGSAPLEEAALGSLSHFSRLHSPLIFHKFPFVSPLAFVSHTKEPPSLLLFALFILNSLSLGQEEERASMLAGRQLDGQACLNFTQQGNKPSQSIEREHGPATFSAQPLVTADSLVCIRSGKARAPLVGANNV